jgi:hypothetical protein
MCSREPRTSILPQQQQQQQQLEQQPARGTRPRKKGNLNQEPYRLCSPSLGESFPLLRPMLWSDFQAGRAGLCLENWRLLTSDPWIIKNLYGYKIEFSQTPYQYHAIPEIKFNHKEKLILENEITALLEKQVIVPSCNEPGQFVSNVFVREKKTPGKFRMIFNLTKLNEFVEYHKF